MKTIIDNLFIITANLLLTKKSKGLLHINPIENYENPCYLIVNIGLEIMKQAYIPIIMDTELDIKIATIMKSEHLDPEEITALYLSKKLVFTIWNEDFSSMLALARFYCSSETYQELTMKFQILMEN